jgi:Flp pilus assembly protein TadD
MLVKAYPTVENWRRMLVLYRDSADAAGEELSSKQKLDLFRLMQTTGALAGERDYYDYAEAAFLAGLPWEAVSVIKVGREDGTISASSSDFNALNDDATKALRAESSLSKYEADARSAASGKLAAQTGDAYLASGEPAKAIVLYDLALEKGGVDTNEVNLHKGVAYVRTGDMASARAHFEKVSGPPQLVDIANFWLTWMDTPELSQAAAPAAEAAPAE